MRKQPNQNLLWHILLSVGFILGCGRGDSDGHRDGSSENATTWEAVSNHVFLPAGGPTESQFPELHNLLQVSGNVFSGAEPKTDAAFGQLAELGVNVIVSVDGVQPKVELAKNARHSVRSHPDWLRRY